MPNPPTFRDHFSGHAEDYSRYRPQYPQTLFDWLATLVPETTRVWDCATGNGQAAVALAQHFSSVHATDASPEQIAAARPHDRVQYTVASAAESGLADDGVGLVTVAQALHWFEPHAFHREVERVLQPGGIVAAWCYEIFKLNDDFDATLDTLYRDILGTDWPPQRRHIETGYRLFDWPWPKMVPPPMHLISNWTIDQTLGYLRTWSATQRWQRREGTDPVALVESELRSTWGESETQTISWPLTLLVSRID